MIGSFRQRGCICKKATDDNAKPKKTRCTCGATWSFRINGTDPRTGKRIQPEFSGYTTKKDAETACAIKIAEIESGFFVPNSKILFKDYAAEWLEKYSKTRKKSSVRVRRNEIRLLNDHLAHLKMTSITRKHYEDCLNGLFEDDYAENTRSGAHAAARLIFKAAMKDGLIKSNPTDFTTVPRKQKSVEELESVEDVPAYLEKEELAKFLSVANQKSRSKGSDGIFFLVLAYTGLRIGELLALMWKDIDFEAMTISITKTLYNEKNNHDEYELLPPKTEASKRVMDVDPYVIEELKKHKAREAEFKMRKRDIYHDKDFVITSRQFPGYPEAATVNENRMKSILKRAGLNTALTPHSLRHTHTSLMAEAGSTLPEIMERLGHSDDEVTKKVYLHVTKAAKKKTAEKFGELMRSIRMN